MLSFLSLVNYYRKLIPNLADLAAPLYLVVQEKHLEKTAELDKAFQILKEEVCKIPTIKIPDPEKPFILETDASALAIGATLKQVNANGEEVPVQWYSH